ncbi:hypothetical protein Hypma_001943 [Hypsizygus marmoreus]|uniref:Uncharacterized protein n=1 Tax=Hypsizygus marmoreus TaxID=39966 RepID=A0A369J4W1_HYPMA|nr:hypothetical protein Hypma_001943 [Hypsizygus marmoreus]
MDPVNHTVDCPSLNWKCGSILLLAYALFVAGNTEDIHAHSQSFFGGDASYAPVSLVLSAKGRSPSRLLPAGQPPCPISL